MKIVHAAMLIVAAAGPAMAQTATPPKQDFGPLKVQHVDARILAQRMVNESLAQHPAVMIMAMHVTPPGKPDNEVIASNIGRIGKRGDPDDLRVIATGESKPEVAKSGDRFEDEVPLHDATGKIIGALGIVFSYKDGDDKGALIKQAEGIRDDMAKRIPNLAALFDPVS